MMSRFVALALLFFVTCVVVQGQMFRIPKPIVPKPGSGSPLIPSIDDIRMCKENANGRKFELVYKLPRQTCKPYCKYQNETQQITAINGQLCCDIVGVGPTGICEDGTCLVGGVFGMN